MRPVKQSRFGKIPACSRLISAEADVNTMILPDPYSTIACGFQGLGAAERKSDASITKKDCGPPPNGLERQRSGLLA